MLRIIDRDGKVLSEFLLSSCVDVSVEHGRCALEALRGAIGPVFARHPTIDNSWFLFNNRSEEMDLKREYIKALDTTQIPETKKILVSPASVELPDDGMLQYVRIANVFDLKELPPHAVAQFGVDAYPVLKLLCDNAALFGFEVRSLVGIPATEYTADYESATWALEKVAYAPFLSELRLGQDIKARLEAESASVYDLERKQVERKDGSVKPHDADVATPDDDESAE